MQLLGLARKFRVSSKSGPPSLDSVVELRTPVHFPGTDYIFSEVGATHACDWNAMIGMDHSAMLTAVSAGIAGISQPWKCPSLTLGGTTLGRCITAPVRTSDSPKRDEFCYVVRTRGRQFRTFSSSVLQISAEVGQPEENVDSKGLKTTIYDSLEIERITVELFPELDFTLEGNFYPNLVKLVARKIKVLFEEEGGEERVLALLQHLGMKLNPHIVAEVMKLQKNPSEASGHFFDWAGNQPEFQHNSHTYNLKFWNLINKKTVGSGNDNLVHALILVDEMVSKGLNPGNLECNVLVDRLCKDKKVGAALKLTRVLERKGFPDLYTYNSLINGLGKAGLFKDMFELLNEMKQRECFPDRVTYNSVINGLCKTGLFEEVFELVEEMTEQGCTPDRVTYNSIIHGLCNARRWQEALKTFDELEDKKVVPDVVTYNSLIVGLFKCGQTDAARNVYDLMGLRGCPADRITYNILINGFLNFGEVDEAWKVFRYMEEQGFSPDEVTYNILIGGLVENYRLAEATRVFATMKDKGCKPNAITYRLLGLSAEEEKHRLERRSNSGNNSFDDPKMMEDERQASHY